MRNNNLIRQFINNEMSEHTEQEFLSRFLKEQIEGDIRNEYQNELHGKYNIKRSDSTKKMWFYVLGVILLLIPGIYLLKSNFFKKDATLNTDRYQLAQLYIQQNEMEYLDNFRGKTINSETLKADGYKAYEAGDYKEALQNWESLRQSDLSSRDELFVGISMLKESRYDKAEILLEHAVHSIIKGEDWYAECNLYYALSLLLNNKEADFEKFTQNWKKDDWEYRQLENLINH